MFTPHTLHVYFHPYNYKYGNKMARLYMVFPLCCTLYDLYPILTLTIY